MNGGLNVMIEILNEQFERRVIKNDDFLCVYPYGSRVYGCNLDGDEDLVIIMDTEEKRHEIQYPLGDRDMSFYTKTTFQEMLVNHDIIALECFFLPQNVKQKEITSFDFELDLEKLRHSVSHVSSNSFVKAKKKLTIEKDFSPYIGRKSLFHSLRILMFGIQIAKFGKIIDYSEANYLWDEIINNQSEEWEDYKIKYQPVYNQLKSEFKKLAPKE